ncbi:kinase domain protein (macronuclear) [Tetrahymena thermophila SB210]|uniref:non-specific serine/threonine protein kinase n=1 Tax=Tetrahymena thermophila (strain SB210) TaxID=312017 RepID=I7M5Y2_TETTS|nr:kinase domain protein [Tetrahymena thermophila SB210]EAR83797.2 kinase domain protein [Tetrahymena thermophila SB210]|eukprot:XP_001031460.2 kinase domain protein [Tetrahymena thermophila SB210]
MTSTNSGNTLKIEHYLVGKTLGCGASGKVKLAKHDITGKEVAIKIINKKKMTVKKMSNKIKREIRLLRFFNHQNIIRLYEVLDTNTDIFVVTEYISGGDLYDVIASKGKLPEQEAKRYFKQIVAGVDYCHRNLVAHRDLKLENILIDDNNNIKIADFGLSNIMNDGKYLSTSCGSPNYAAPEVISGKLYCGTEVDTWSCGVILFALLGGYLPFDEEVIPALYKKIKEGDFQIPAFFSPEAHDIIKRMLRPNPIERIKFHELRLHPWLRENVPFYVEIFNQNTRMESKKLNEDILRKLAQMKNVNFHNLNEQTIRDAVIKRDDYSFVIAYDLLLDDYKKNNYYNKENNQNTFIFRPVQEDCTVETNNAYIDQIFNQGKLEEVTEEEEEILGQWTYGKIYSNSARTIMKAIYEVASQLDIVITIKNSEYRIKCHRKNPKKIQSAYNNHLETIKSESSSNLSTNYTNNGNLNNSHHHHHSYNNHYHHVNPQNQNFTGFQSGSNVSMTNNFQHTQTNSYLMPPQGNQFNNQMSNVSNDFGQNMESQSQSYAIGSNFNNMNYSQSGYQFDSGMNLNNGNTQNPNNSQNNALDTNNIPKFSKQDLVFTIQIYQMPSTSIQSDQHIVDVILNKGHPIMFLEFFNQFLTLVNKKLNPIH